MSEIKGRYTEALFHVNIRTALNDCIFWGEKFYFVFLYNVENKILVHPVHLATKIT